MYDNERSKDNVHCGVALNSTARPVCTLTMRLSDARLRCRETKLIYPDHRPSPWLIKMRPRDRSNRLLDDIYHKFTRRCTRLGGCEALGQDFRVSWDAR